MAEEKVVAVKKVAEVPETLTLENFLRDSAGSAVMRHNLSVTVGSSNTVIATVQPLGGGAAMEYTVVGNEFKPKAV